MLDFLTSVSRAAHAVASAGGCRAVYEHFGGPLCSMETGFHFRDSRGNGRLRGQSSRSPAPSVDFRPLVNGKDPRKQNSTKLLLPNNNGFLDLQILRG